MDAFFAPTFAQYRGYDNPCPAFSKGEEETWSVPLHCQHMGCSLSPHWTEALRCDKPRTGAWCSVLKWSQTNGNKEPLGREPDSAWAKVSYQDKEEKWGCLSEGIYSPHHSSAWVLNWHIPQADTSFPRDSAFCLTILSVVEILSRNCIKAFQLKEPKEETKGWYMVLLDLPRMPQSLSPCACSGSWPHCYFW